MKRALLFGPSGLVLACGPLLGQQPSGAATRDIRALYQGYMEAFNKKDVAKIMSFFVPGSDLFVFDVTPPRQHVGWADYKKDWEDLFGAFPGPLHQELSDLSVTPGEGAQERHRTGPPSPSPGVTRWPFRTMSWPGITRALTAPG